ncbi:hypothetical protein Lfu02_49970 [Longispora fulva]|nr:hypothetical protein Lfu02_49970 [Longispora fulva]
MRFGRWVWLLVGGLALVGLGAFFVVAGLDRADKLASAIGLFVGLGGLGVSVYGLVLTRRVPPVESGQSMNKSAVGGSVNQIRDVHGNVKFGPPAPSRAPATAPSSAPTGPAGSEAVVAPDGQRVTESQVCGDVLQVDGVVGDVDIDR